MEISKDIEVEFEIGIEIEVDRQIYISTIRLMQLIS